MIKGECLKLGYSPACPPPAPSCLKGYAGRELEALIRLLQKLFFLKPVAALVAVSCTSLGGTGAQEFLETLVLHDAALLGLYKVWCVRR